MPNNTEMRISAVWFSIAIVAAQDIHFQSVASNLLQLTDIQNAADGTNRLFFVQQHGIVRVFRNGALLPQPFLDIQSKTRASGERGLLGLAFPPEFAQKQRFYVNYTDLNGNTVIAQYRMSSSPDVADSGSETILMNISQPFPNHNGGQLRFGKDGYLYIAMGDGGSGGDPQGNGQNLNTLLGKILRVDVESDPGRVQIPQTNPFVNMAGRRGEIWAYGLRNPWRFSFDRATHDLWIADVGQNQYEEVNFQPSSSHGGENYGWVQMEGAHCYRAQCNVEGLTLPVAEYTHSLGCSITGGLVYRGSRSPGMRGLYLYGDYCSGRIWSLEKQAGSWVNQLAAASNFTISTFGEDEAGELYVANVADSTIYRIDGSLAPRLNAASVVNAASFQKGLTPGSLATAFVAGIRDAEGITQADSLPLPLKLGDVSITINGTPVPILAVANVNGQEQVNFQVPFNVSGSTVQVAVLRADRTSTSVPVTLTAVQPAIYTSDGTRAIVVHNTDYRLVDQNAPLIPGEYAFLYATGLGDVDNRPTPGAATPSTPLSRTLTSVRVIIGGIETEVPFSGLAPDLVGVYQVNFKVPQVPSGMQSLVISAGSETSPTVQVPVQ